MPLTQDQEDLEHELRVRKMESDMRKTDFDIAKGFRDLENEDRRIYRQTWTIFLQVLGLVIASVAAGVALANYVNAHGAHH